MARPLLRLLVPLCFAATAAPSCNCEGTTLDTLRPNVEVETSEALFDDTWVGLQSESAIVLSNAGGAPTTLAFAVTGDAFELRQTAEAVIEPGATFALEVRFGPLFAGTHEGQLQISGEGLVGEGIDGEGVDGETIDVPLAGLGVTIPECDDDNECTDDRFDTATEQCEHSAHGRTCGEDNACLMEARCVQGACVGSFRTCEATAPCRAAACDPETGCIDVEIAGACEDDNPCTDDVCSDVGCTNAPSSDFTPCGAFVQCVSASVCQAGACIDVAIADGTPCSDGQLCTEDACQGGVCVGEPTLGDPVLVSTTLHPGGRLSSPVALPDGRLLLFDPWTKGNPGTTTGILRTLVREDDGWSVDSAVEANTGFSAHRLGSDGHSEWFAAGPSGVGRFAGHVLPDGSFDMHELAGSVTDLAFLGEHIYACVQSNPAGFRIYSVASGSPVLLSEVPIGDACNAVEVDPLLERLVVWYAVAGGASATLAVFDLSNPVAPSLLHDFPTPGGALVSAGDGVVAFARRGSDENYLEVFSLEAPWDSYQLLPPLGQDDPGPPTVADGAIYVRWSRAEDPWNASLYRRTLDTASPWELLTRAATRLTIAPRVVRVEDLLVIPAHGEAGTLMLRFIDGPGSALLPLNIDHSRGGALMPSGSMMMNLAPDSLSYVETTFPDTPSWFSFLYLDPLTNAAVVNTALPPGAFGPFSPASMGSSDGPPLVFERGPLVRVEFTPNTHYITLTAAPEVPEDHVVASPFLYRSGALAGDRTVIVTADDSEAGGPIVLSVYDPPPPPLVEDDTWPAIGEVTLVPNATSFGLLPIAASEDRVVVLAPPPDGLFLIDIADPTQPQVLATMQVSFSLPYFPVLGVSGDNVLFLHSYAIAGRFTRQEDVLVQTDDVTDLLQDWPAGLAFDGELALLATDTGVDYLRFDPTPEIQHSIALGERPIDIAEVQGRLYVTTDHGVHVVQPPCPAP